MASSYNASPQTTATAEPVTVEESLLDPSPPPEAGATEKKDDVEENNASRPESDTGESTVSAQLNRSLSNKRNALPKRVSEKGRHDPPILLLQNGTDSE